MPGSDRSDPQVVGIAYDCSATGLLGLEALVYNPQRVRMETSHARWGRGLENEEVVAECWNSM